MVEPRKAGPTPPAVKSRPQLPKSWMLPSQGNSSNSGERQTSQGVDNHRKRDESPIVFLERNTSSQKFVRRRLSPPRLIRQESTSEDGETNPDDVASREAQYSDDQDEVSFDTSIDSCVSDDENEFSKPAFPRFKKAEECILLYKGCACKATIADIQEKEGILQYKVTFKYLIWFLHSFVRFDQELGQLFKLNPENPITPDTPIQTPGEGACPDDFMGPSPPKDLPTNTKDMPSTSGQTKISNDSSQQVFLASEIPLEDHRETFIPYSDTVPTPENEAEPELVDGHVKGRATSGKEPTQIAAFSPNTKHVERSYPSITGFRDPRSRRDLMNTFLNFDGRKKAQITSSETAAERGTNNSLVPSEANTGLAPTDDPRNHQKLKRKATKEKKDIPSTSDASSKHPRTKKQKVKETEPRVISEGPQDSSSSDSSPNTSPKNVKKSKRD